MEIDVSRERMEVSREIAAANSMENSPQFLGQDSPRYIFYPPHA
jgi:hypothetical protein